MRHRERVMTMIVYPKGNGAQMKIVEGAIYG